MTSRMLHMVPATPPAFDGLGDYARMLQRHWPDPQPEWHVAALRVTPGAEEAWPGVRFHAFEPNADSVQSVLSASGCETLGLHYVPHGYHPKGAPEWLPKGLARWKAASGGRVVVFFHELFAYGPPWRSSFWMVPRAVRTFRQVVSLADASMTSNPLYARMLKNFGGARSSIGVVPIGSNIAATAQASPPGPGALRVAAFGGAGTRVRALGMHRPFLSGLAEAGRLESIVLIGSRGGGEDIALAGAFAPTESVLDATEAQASEAMASCHLGLVSTIEPVLYKSGVFAAYCAHRLVPIVSGKAPDGPYIATGGDSPRRSVGLLSDPLHMAALQDRVAQHAARSAWPAIATRWADLA